MKNISKISIVIKNNQKHSKALVEVHTFNTQEKIKRSLKGLGICLGLAFLSLFIPLAHFILVPLFLLAALIAPFYIYSIESLILGGKGRYPKCEAELLIEKGTDKWPLQDLCTHCRTRVEIIKDISQ